MGEKYSQEFLEIVKPRKLDRSLEDYWRSLGDYANTDFSSLGYQWADQPHRHVFDLIAYGRHQEDRIRALEEALAPFAEEADAQDLRNPHANDSLATVAQFTIGKVRHARAARDA